MHRSLAVALAVLCAPALHAAEQVRVGAYVLRLNDLNPAAQSFSADISIWTLSSATAHFHPIQSLRLQNTRSLAAEAPGEWTENGMLWGYFEASAVINKHWDTRHFPFDRHTLAIRMTESVDDADTLLYVADAANSKVDPGVKVPGWKITGTRLETHVHQYPSRFGDPRPGAASTRWSEAWLLIDVRRNGVGIFLKIVIVAYIAFALLMLSFLLDASLFSSRISLLVGSLFATVINMRASEAVIGRTDDFTLVDQIHLLVAFFILVSAASALFTRRMASERAHRIDRWTAIVSGAAFVVANVLLIGSAFIAHANS